ncbi:hypothetical protein LOD99_11673 [Oopsacas minuta]|uniref:HTH OST-type domain-containing protein n=1 Tax=Oopsacas minuta TaxID=111878 RepID=A0AAV7JK35_9METZ|nr:hypothetical protein LOD99_11673 [Oopsacas minuta]
MTDDQLSQMKKSLRAVLISCPEGTPLAKVESDYRSFMGESLSYRQFGFRNIESFLRSIPDTVRVSGPIAYGVACEEIKHVTKLINNQRKVTSNLKNVRRARDNARLQPFFPHPSIPNKYSWGSGAPQHAPLYPPLPPPHHPIHYSQYGHRHHGPPRHPGPHGPQQMRHPPFYPPPVTPPLPSHSDFHPSSHPPKFQPSAPLNSPHSHSPSPTPSETGDEIIFSNAEIIELLKKEDVYITKQLVIILSLAFPYIYRGSHIAILDLSIPLCIDIATAVAFDCEEELEGTPAILVCKMQDVYDCTQLEKSSRVKLFNVNEFKSTKVKVLTIKFPEMINLLTSNNDHFYKSVTFVIFVDIKPAHMLIIHDLLPPELQYLFLFTSSCNGISYKPPHVVIRKWGTQYTDVAYNNETIIDKLKYKLSYLNNSPIPSPSTLLPTPPVVTQQTTTQPPPRPTEQQQQQQAAKKPTPSEENSPVRTNCVSATERTRFPSDGLRHLSEASFKANINMFIQAGPNKGKTCLLIEFALSKVDVTQDMLQVILTAPNPKTSGQLFLRLKEYVNLQDITEVRAFGYTEGNFEKLSLYISEQKVHVLVIENSHLPALQSKSPALLKNCKLLGCDELYGSFYTKQVPTTVSGCFRKLNPNTTQIITIAHPSDKEEILQSHMPKPFWHIKEEIGSTEQKEKYLVTFFNNN